MYTIKTLNKIAKCGLENFGANYQVGDEIENPDAIILRSFNMHEMELGDNLKAVARAGAGVNNIPIDKCTERGIVVFNTPGANANAVKELVLAGLFLSSRKVVSGIEWVKTLKGEGDAVTKLVEKGKSQFAGPEIKGKTLGVIGLGAIGVMVANTAVSLGMEVIGYDPFMSVDSAWSIRREVKKASEIKEVFENSDYITLHVPQNDSTKGMINKESLADTKDGVRILNFARGGLVNDDDLADALESGKVSCYVTDFPDEKILEMKNVVAIPHLGASTGESEDNCAVMAAKELVDYLENGNITNSVNFPACSMPKVENEVRFCIIHKNVPSVINKITALFSEKSINIENMINKSKKEVAITLIDTDTEVSKSDVESLRAINDVICVRVIK